jgi:hypothetical protein
MKNMNRSCKPYSSLLTEDVEIISSAGEGQTNAMTQS